MEEKKNRKPVRKENPFREWVSDNLRYILLIAAIAVVAAAVVLIVSAVSRHSSAQEPPAAESVGTAEDPQDSGEEDPEGTPVPSEGPQETATPAPEEEPVLEPADSDVTAAVTGYLEALAAGDADSLAAYVDELSEEDRAVVENNQRIDAYSNIEVFTYPGPEEDTWVAFASYDYRYAGYDTALPGLTQLYLYQAADGKLQIASDTSEGEIAGYISGILEKEDVKELITSIQKEYDAVLAAHGDLKAYVDGLN
jgi:hypothetical protein